MPFGVKKNRTFTNLPAALRNQAFEPLRGFLLDFSGIATGVV